ncbi:hypothetical protein [Cellulosilyticum sp. I15G10I2]|uniref:hypothetical protein n=1 Tax=Cellulosilyticum sp. I15G10I2 TaxID=1892843 RepID=UPI00085C287F|nr:hypothetical protein [Cellulosilyticum sp. I15G10I2]
MKNKLFVMLLFLWLIAYPAYANTAYGNTMYSISLNGLAYMPQYAVYQLNNTLYLSTSDLASLTYSKITSDSPNTYTMSIQNHTIDFSPNERIVRINHKPTILVHMPLMQGGQVYLPINILDTVEYPYHVDEKEKHLAIVPISPYARTSDSYKDHIFFDSKIINLSAAIKMLVPENKGNILLQEAKKNDSYISFIDNTDKDYLLDIMSSDLLKGKSLQVAFREIDVLSSTPSVSGLTFMPLKVSVDHTQFTAQIGEDSLTYNCIWAAYMPSDSNLKIDVSKSLDATLMRMLYQYYRDQYDLKDDLYFSPVVPIKTGRVDSLSFTTYSDHILDQNNVYDVIIYKIIDANTITYMIDFMIHHK